MDYPIRSVTNFLLLKNITKKWKILDIKLMYIPASGGPANDPTPSKIKRIPYPTAKLCSPRNSIIIGGSKGPPTADKNPKMTFVISTAAIIEIIIYYAQVYSSE